MLRRPICILPAAALLLALFMPSASASSSTVQPTALLPTGGFSIVQPDDKYAGKTYGQWSASWWQWAAAISKPNSPVDDPNGDNCAVNQQGPVWFIAGNTTGGTTRRTCTVPDGKGILVPIINGECSTVEGNGTTEQELRACAKGQIDAVTVTEATIDGRAVNLGRPNVGRFRFVSPLFQISFAPNNAFGVNAGTGKSVADGFWVLVKPLKTGNHTIDFHGRAVFPGSPPFDIDLHYKLKVTGE